MEFKDDTAKTEMKAKCVLYAPYQVPDFDCTTDTFDSTSEVSIWENNTPSTPLYNCISFGSAKI